MDGREGSTHRRNDEHLLECLTHGAECLAEGQLADTRADRDDWKDMAEAFREDLTCRGGEAAVTAAIEAFYCRPDVAARYWGSAQGCHACDHGSTSHLGSTEGGACIRDYCSCPGLVILAAVGVPADQERNEQ